MEKENRKRNELVRAGDLDFVRDLAREPEPEPEPVTSAQEKLLIAGVEIAQALPSSADMAFTHAVLCQVGLPRSGVEGREFMRQCGKAWLQVQAGVLDEGRGPVWQPVPYGAMPRLALAWVSTFAVKHRSRQIPIGESAAEFLRLMGLGDDGRRYSALRKQMHALAACRIQLGYLGRTYSGQPVEQFDAWMANKDHQRSLWPGVMVLSDGYYRSLIQAPVPLDNRAMIQLKGSAFALDVYVWLAHRLHRIDGQPIEIKWERLREQFGQEYKDLRSFKQEFLRVLKLVLTVYPKARVKPIEGGLLLYASSPPIPFKGTA
jgi:Plasmid encoded RepA protein